MRDRRSVLVISHMYPRRTHEGYGTFVAEQLRALVALEPAATVRVISPTRWAPWPLPLLSDKWRRYAETERARVDFDRVDVAFPRYLALPRKLGRGLAARTCASAIGRNAQLGTWADDADVVVAHSAMLDGWVARLLSRRSDTSYVVVVHGEDVYQNTLGPHTASRRRQLARVLSAAARVVAVSTPLRHSLEAAYDLAGDVAVLPNGVDTTLFRPAMRALLPGAPIRLMSAGHLVPRKANDVVLRAVAQLRGEGLDVTHTIAGDGPERAALEQLTDSLGIRPHVRFTGAYRHEELPALLAEADLFVLPSWDEAFGVVYLEAMATGLAAVGANDAGVTDVIEDGRSGYLVPPHDVGALAAAVRAFAELDEPSRERMRVAAIARAGEHTWERNARDLLEILDSLR